MQTSGSLALVRPLARVRRLIARAPHPNLEALVEQAHRCETACDLLLEILENAAASEPLFERILLLESESQKANFALTAGLRSSFLTPLDVEDVQSLSNAFVRIIQAARRSAGNARMLPGRLSLVPVQREIAGMVSGISATVRMVVAGEPAFEGAVSVLRRQREVRLALRNATASAMISSGGDIYALLAHHRMNASLADLVHRLRKAITGLQWLILKNG